MKKEYKNKWLSFQPKFELSHIELNKAGYFDEHPVIVATLTNLIGLFASLITPIFLGFGLIFFISLFLFIFPIGYGYCFIHLPIKTGIDECDPPKYGYYFYNDSGKLIPDSY